MAVDRRQSVGGEVYPQEAAAPAARVFQKASRREGVPPDTRVRHADNGAPMTGATRRVMRQRLGVVPAFSRPAVSNAPPCSAAQFHTVTGRPDCPTEPCDAPEAARRGVRQFVAWYHNGHRHRAPKCVTPVQRPRGEEVDLLAPREVLYQAARAANPSRESGPTRAGTAPVSVSLNPGKPPRGQGFSDTAAT